MKELLKKISQKELAEIIGCDISMISRIIKGERKIPPIFYSALKEKNLLTDELSKFLKEHQQKLTLNLSRVNTPERELFLEKVGEVLNEDFSKVDIYILKKILNRRKIKGKKIKELSEKLGYGKYKLEKLRKTDNFFPEDFFGKFTKEIELSENEKNKLEILIKTVYQKIDTTELSVKQIKTLNDLKKEYYFINKNENKKNI